MNASWQGKRWWALAAAVAALGGGGWLARWPWRGAENLPTAVVRRGDLNEFVRCRGKLAVRQAAFLIVPRGVENLRIVFLAPGGSRVRRGQVVVRLDVSGLQQKARQRALALRTARAKLRQAETQTQITHQQDLLALVEDQVAAGRAQLQARRESILSRIAGQESRLALATAQAKVTAQRAEARLHAAAAVAQLQALRQARDKAAAELRREQSVIAAATLRAPSAGLVTYMMNYDNFTNPHAYRVGDSVSAGDEIGQIPNLQTLEIHANLPQTDRGQVRNGDPVRARVSALPEARFTGRVARIAQLTSLDFSGSWPPPRIFQLAATLDHPDPRLRPQMTATVRVVTRRLRHVLLVPAQAVFTRRGKAIVYVEQGGAFRPRRVTVLGRNPTEAALRGLVPGLRVALTRPGAKPRARAAANPAGAEGANP